jgi:hypothetical protein
VHQGDDVWRAALARDYFTTAQLKWAEFLGGAGEQRAVARYEFLADLDAWVHAFCAPQAEGSPTADLLIAGMFGNDAIMVSEIGSKPDKRGRRRNQKLYRIFRNDGAKQKFPSLLRLPQTESLFLPGGEEAVAVDTSESQDDRIICGYDTLLVVARHIGGQLRFRVVRPGEKLFVSPIHLEQAQETFVPAGGVLKQAKAALRSMLPERRPEELKKTRVYRTTPTTVALSQGGAAARAGSAGESTEILGAGGEAPAKIRDTLLEANKELLAEDGPLEMRPSISTALRLSEHTLVAIQGDLLAIESDAQAVSDRQAGVSDPGGEKPRA